MEWSRINRVVVLTGAGISAESGIQTFRDQGGLWEEHRIEDVATPEGFKRNPILVHDFYNKRRDSLKSSNIKPNQGHLALAEFEHKFHGEFTLITQNVDNLHEAAGSKNILHMHGELTKVRCNSSNKVFDWQADTSIELKCQCCDTSGSLRPHIVWFGEIPFFMDKISDLLNNCDLFLSIGTSGQVYPAAMFVKACKIYRNAYAVEINLESTHISPYFNLQIEGKASLRVPEFFNSYYEQRSFL